MAAFNSFQEFYTYYLQEHRHPLNRRLHLIGTSSALTLLALFLITDIWWFLLAAPIVGYGLAWVGHFRVEGNKPATFSHPFYSLAADFRMLYDALTGKLR